MLELLTTALERRPARRARSARGDPALLGRGPCSSPCRGSSISHRHDDRRPRSTTLDRELADARREVPRAVTVPPQQRAHRRPPRGRPRRRGGRDRRRARRRARRHRRRGRPRRRRPAGSRSSPSTPTTSPSAPRGGARKLVHGGLRYLAKGQVGVAHESAVERGILMTRTAPHLTRAMPMVIPLTAAVSQAAGDRSRCRGSAPATLLRAAARTPRSPAAPPPPALGRGDRRAGPDGHPRRAPRRPALLRRPARGRRPPRRRARPHRRGVRRPDRSPGPAPSTSPATARRSATSSPARRLEVRARAVVNAAGVWAGQVVPGLTLSRAAAPTSCSAATRCPGSTSPSRRRCPGRSTASSSRCRSPTALVYVGLTDEPAAGDIPDVPIAERVRGRLPARARSTRPSTTPLTRDDVVGTYSGLRPLLRRRGRQHRRPVPQARGAHLRHRRRHGGRRQAHDLPPDGRGRRRRRGRPAAGSSAGPCRTPHLPLVGAAPGPTLAAVVDRTARAAGPAVRRRGAPRPGGRRGAHRPVPTTSCSPRWPPSGAR